VLIGGTAATLAMEEAGLEFRATKDLDIVLHLEALNAAFRRSVLEIREKGATKSDRPATPAKQVFYRFQKPANQRFDLTFRRSAAGYLPPPMAFL
jgi:hypothetical protein